jgi:uncharacterized membrane protein
MLKAVPPNKVYGFRTRQTLANRELWFRANRFAGTALFIAAGTSAVIFLLQPGYASGRSAVGLAVFVVPLLYSPVLRMFGVWVVAANDDDLQHDGLDRGA